MTVSLADLTTLRVGGPAGRLVEAATEAELIAAVLEADDAAEPLLVLGGGSNLLVDDAGFPGVVVRDARSGITVPDASACAGSTVVVLGGTPWDDVVAFAVETGLEGIEALSGIPGATGATPVQNVGAYGQDVGQSIASVRVLDRQTRAVRTLPVASLELGYRSSVLKRSTVWGTERAATERERALPGPWRPTPRFVVLDVSLQLRWNKLSSTIAYAELARRLDVEVGDRVPLADARRAVLELRAGKGMVLDPADHDTWSAGSFFTNPVVTAGEADRLGPEAPRFPAGPGLVKVPAAWLIERAGFSKGFSLGGPASLSTKHALALTNRGGARSDDLLAVARAVRDGVREATGVTLEPEPVLVGCAL